MPRLVTRRLLIPAISLAAFCFYFISSISGSGPTDSEIPNLNSLAFQQVPNIPPEQEENPPFPVTLTFEIDEPHSPTCSVLKLSMLYGAHVFPQYLSAIDTHRQHSKRWGCGFDNLNFELTTRRHFSKQYFILSHMLHEMAKPADQRKEWIMWSDADSIVLNPAISPGAFLPPAHLTDVYAIMTADHQGLNDGVFFLRICDASVDLLTEVIDYQFAQPDEDLGWLGEQAAMERVLAKREAAARQEGVSTGVAWVPRVWFNAYQWEHGFEGEPGHHIVHFAGLAETRVGHMESWLLELETNRSRWEVNPAKTLYHAAIPDFWHEYSVNKSMLAQ